MAFAGISYLAIVIAAVAAWIAGAAWYMTLGKFWIAALGMTREEMEANRKDPKAFLPFIYVFVAELIMAWVLAGLIGHLGPGQVTIRNGVISGLFIWFGFVLTTIFVNNAFARRKWSLTLIDGGHWLLVLVVMGAVIGGIGV
jgi:hypothetical protein